MLEYMSTGLDITQTFVTDIVFVVLLTIIGLCMQRPIGYSKEVMFKEERKISGLFSVKMACLLCRTHLVMGDNYRSILLLLL